MLASGKPALYTNRVAWAITRMATGRAPSSAAGGPYVLSECGNDVAQAHPGPFDLSVLAQFPENHEFRVRKREKHPRSPAPGF